VEEAEEEEEEEQGWKHHGNRTKANQPQEEEHCGKRAKRTWVEPFAWAHWSRSREQGHGGPARTAPHLPAKDQGSSLVGNDRGGCGETKFHHVGDWCPMPRSLHRNHTHPMRYSVPGFAD